MTRREQLQNQYEDALFALLMDELGAAEVQKAETENERLKSDPSAQVPEALDRRCMQTIRKEFGKRRFRAAGRFAVIALKRVALAAGIAAILFTTVFAASETVRVNTMNWIVQVFDSSVDFHFAGRGSNDPILQMDVGWVPEGYHLESCGYSSAFTWYLYQKSEKEQIHMEYTLTFGAGFGVDTEDAKVSHLEIQGSQAMLVEKGNELQLVWVTENNTAFIGLIGTGVEQEELIHVANELSY